jgi:MFS family permease
MRPIGGAMIGALADRAGRKPAMLVTIAPVARVGGREERLADRLGEEGVDGEVVEFEGVAEHDAMIGALADRAGRKPAMLVTIALMALGMLMLAACPGANKAAQPWLAICQLVTKPRCRGGAASSR